MEFESLKKNLYRPDEVADFFSVTIRAVYLWIEKDLLRPIYGKTGAMKISRDEIIRLCVPVEIKINEEKRIREVLNTRIGTGMRSSIKGAPYINNWEYLVGYNVNKLKKHLEKQFTEGMSWERFIDGEIHIDHIVPKAVFNYKSSSDHDFKRCWALKNLQPMWASENIRKGAKLSKHFQPSLF